MSTPARGTRSRSAQGQPLPVARSGLANSYGTRGSANIEGQMDEEGDFAGALGTRQKTSRPVARTPREESQSPTKRNPRLARKPATPIEEESEPEPSPKRPSPERRTERPASDQGTAIDNVAGYEVLTPPNIRPRSARRSPSVASSIHEPSNFTVVMHLLLKLLVALKNLVRDSPLLLLLLVLLTAGTVFFKVPTLPTNELEHIRERAIRGARVIAGLKEWQGPPQGLEKEWIEFKEFRLLHPDQLPDKNLPEFQWAININVIGRLERLETTTREVSAALDDIKKTIESVLPRLVVVDVVDNRLQISEELYEALQQRLAGDEVLWSAFLERNMEAINRVETDRLHTFMDDAQRNRHIVSAATALDMIRGEIAALREAFAKDSEEQRTEFLNSFRNIIEMQVVDVLQKQPGGYRSITALQKEHHIENTIAALHNYDFFARNTGAKVYMPLTSPNVRRPRKTMTEKFVGYWFDASTGPESAIMDWAQFGHAWCAAGTMISKLGKAVKAQLAIDIADYASPTAFVVEHVPASGTLHIDNAPRDVELWMDVGDEVSVRNVKDIIETESTRLIIDGPCGESPDPTFVCVGRGRYDIHHDNWIQTFPAFTDLSKHWVRSKRFLVKVATNWGAEETCLYRVRLYGKHPQ